jgi:molecular chaperone HscB
MDNYFDIFSMNTTCSVNLADLKQKYQNLQKQYHPDRYASSTEEIKQQAIYNSSLINLAYQTLKNSLLRIEHILELQSINIKDDKTPIDIDFLSQHMQLQEQISSSDKTQEQIESLISKINAEYQQHIDDITNLITDKKYQETVPIFKELNFIEKIKNQLDDY